MAQELAFNDEHAAHIHIKCMTVSLRWLNSQGVTLIRSVPKLTVSKLKTDIDTLIL